jgi:hypothetical protein
VVGATVGGGATVLVAAAGAPHADNQVIMTMPKVRHAFFISCSSFGE